MTRCASPGASSRGRPVPSAEIWPALEGPPRGHDQRVHGNPAILVTLSVRRLTLNMSHERWSRTISVPSATGTTPRYTCDCARCGTTARCDGAERESETQRCLTEVSGRHAMNTTQGSNVVRPIFIGRWVPKMQLPLKERPYRRGKLRRNLGSVSQRMLTRNLRILLSRASLEDLFKGRSQLLVYTSCWCPITQQAAPPARRARTGSTALSSIWSTMTPCFGR
jgi:hypothetical protein